MKSSPEATRRLHIAWVAFAPSEEVGGVPGISTDLLHGLAELGHRVDCFFPGPDRPLTPRIDDLANITYVWGNSHWRWNRWYSRTRLTSFVSAQLTSTIASLRLRSVLLRRHRDDPYDVLYQFSNTENRAVPRRLRKVVPVVVHPGQSSADALRFLLRERALHLRTRPPYALLLAAAALMYRVGAQRRQLRRAALVICISDVFREHLIRDYGVRRERTVVVANPVRVDRFTAKESPPGDPATVLVLGRIATGKGLESVIALARLALERELGLRFRIVGGGTSLWSNYTELLDDLPSENSEHVGHVVSVDVPGEYARSDILLQASRYEAFALTVAEALAGGLPVVATSEVGAVERVDRRVAELVAPDDVEAMATAILATLERLHADPAGIRRLARAEAERLFTPETVCAEITRALERLVAEPAVDGDGEGDELTGFAR
jgi:glycosyltransferase involved in cell wall biosynthesis